MAPQSAKTTPKKAGKVSPQKTIKKSPTKAGKDAAPPKRGQSAFFIWLGENRAKIIKDQGFEKKDLAKIGKFAGEAWGKMSDAAKAPFVKKAEADKQRYEREMANYDGPAKVRKSKKGKKGKKEKDPNAPKRGMGAYFMWLNENRAKIMKEHGFEKKDIMKVGKVAGEAWGKMSDEAKAPFVKKAE